MAATIQRIYDNVNDPRVYGNQIVTYSVNGAAETDFSSVIALASLKQSSAIESATTAFSKVVDVRRKKVSALGDVLATLIEAIGSMDTKSQDTGRESKISTAKLKEAKQILSDYGVCNLTLTSSGQITYAEATSRQNDVQTALDNENNDLSQACNLMQSFINRRDNAYKTASRIVKKDDTTATSTIHAIGA